MSQPIPTDESHYAMLRGVRNCGGHHEENKSSPALWFAKDCDPCAALIFETLYNAGVNAMAFHAANVSRNHRYR